MDPIRQSGVLIADLQSSPSRKCLAKKLKPKEGADHFPTLASTAKEEVSESSILGLQRVGCSASLSRHDIPLSLFLRFSRVR